MASSKREAREFIRNGAISINGEKNNQEGYILSKSDAIEERFIVVRRGKKKYALAEII